MATGYLKVELRAAENSYPVVGAHIDFFVGASLVATSVTDASGTSDTIAFDAPAKELSLDENYDGLVYSTCSITVYANRYRTTSVIDIQIFADETALQQLELEPMTILNSPNSRSAQIYRIPKHILNDETEWSSGSDDCTASLILDRVVIPQYITVHLGKPDSYASNVRVSFSSYIKNVCCSEIYPTWPESALRANIYCQISLALNRIFTEWYPSRNYPFDITNSTQYDQYYVHGRNIFANISRIVDEIFDNYIRKDGHTEPFYAEYCNGTTATCPGLKQWGTVNLAEQGYSPIGILKYYYGNNIGIYTAPAIAGTVSSYGGVPLRVGSTGSAVTTIQTQLTRIRKNYPVIPSVGSIDGVFGTATQAAVTKFQGVFNLTQDGVVGKATWYKISYIYTAVLKLAELTSEGIPAVPGTTPVTVLRRGSRGEYVGVAQYMLTLAAQYYTVLLPIAIDNIFGNATYNAVVEFQNLRGITADGIIGKNTWDELYEIYYSVFDSLIPPSIPYPGTLLQRGSSGTSVLTMQRMLNVIAVFFTSIKKLDIDGKFGGATESSVKAFQGLFGLKVDGIIGPNTWNAIVTVYDNLAI